MKVSVVIPTFNRARYLSQSVGSALDQTFTDLEVVVVDDGSTDNTQEVLASVKDPRVRYIGQENRGVAAALNTGCRAARGEYIARLDSDDVWLPNLLEELVPSLEADPTLGLIYARAQWMDANGHLLAQILGAPIKFPGQTLKSLLYGDSVCPIAVVFRRLAVERAGGFDETLIGNEDWDLWIRMAKDTRFAYRDAILAHYRFHLENLTASSSSRFMRLMADRVRVLDKFYSGSDVCPDAFKIKPLAYRNLYQDIAIRHLSIGDWRGALHYFGLALRTSPQSLLSAPRVAAVALFYLYLSKTNWGVRLTEAMTSRSVR